MQHNPVMAHLDKENEIGREFGNLKSLDIRFTMSFVFLQVARDHQYTHTPPISMDLLLYSVELCEEVKQWHLRNTVTFNVIL